MLYAVLFAPMLANAQQNRTAVSINGLDTNSCTVASPCRSFTKAISQTNASGEVIALDSGGYGVFTVDRAITIQAAPGIYAGVTATSGDAIDINAGSSSSVVLRNLVLSGLGSASAGIAATGSAAEVHIESCLIQNFATYGVFSFLNVRISDTTIRKCGSGVWIDNAGGPVKATLVNVVAKELDGGDPTAPGTGILAWRNSDVTVRNSVVVKATNSGFRAGGGGILNLDTCTATDNGTGIVSGGLGLLAAGTVRISNNLVTGNATGILNNQGATIETWQNNKVAGNSVADVTGTLTNILQN